MTAIGRLGMGALLFLGLFTFGVAGYMSIEGWSFVDALFMTAITVTTVGFEEVHPLDTAGKIFTIDAILRDAGIERARGLLAASDSDAGNTFIVLTAKALRPDLYVISRAARAESQPRMRRAGADRAISPYAIAGRRMALSALQPLMVEFIDTLATGRHEEQILAEIEISQESGLAGRTIQEVTQDCRRSVVLGVQRSTGTIQVGPRGDTTLETGDRLIVLGEESELEAIRPARNQGG